jgi:monoamine oxidase
MDYHVKGGNTKILDTLYKEVGKKNVHLDEIVQGIHDAAVVTIKTAKCSYEARAVLVTVGLKQLKHITVTPALKEKRQKANKLSYGDITKAFISFKGNLSFKKQKLAFFSESEIPYVYVTTQGQSESRFGLCVYAVGTAAKKIAKMKESVFIKKVLKVLPKDVFPVDDLIVEDVFVQHWGAQRYSEGAYCIFNPSEHRDIQDSFGVPHGNIYFAGDYLGEFFNYMNGAFQSGRDVMHGIVKSLR